MKVIEKVLGSYLNASNLKEKQEILKLTWHDLKHNKANETTESTVKTDTPRGGNITVTDTNKTVSMVDKTGDGEKSKNSSSSANDTVSEKEKQKNWLKNVVGKLKDKISLLRDIAEIKSSKKKRSDKLVTNPYASFRRMKIAGKLDWLNANMLTSSRKVSKSVIGKPEILSGKAKRTNCKEAKLL